ncbi:hypothetical protein TPB0596_18920 [Tsukamurella pulmonis]|uniref:Low molecular weight antigen MTB12-like C-terminal domain-containing protein n=1 Tax=Tsukamurella pulmonis TaxID=47312 RepID=A0A1H1FWQ4_9ACTN|nr:hypothetical protein [Tsukamurella pulmonis]BDD82129.1 hypothetical protein TPB0596_18920 [Tsukamurella pulmonis]SDR05118.1 hypothetical protein SAMN04489765_2951 [Tsukamurella pulmonis]SUP18323.1 Uncharacterised protein [Tsukamurella pulmonis]
MRGRVLMAPAAVLVGLACAACGTDGGEARSSAPSPASIQVTEAPSTTPDRAPSTQQLDEMLTRAVDPQVPLEDKIQLVQGATPADGPLFDELVKLRQDNPQVSWNISRPVLEQPGLAKAQFSVLMGGTNQLAYASLAFDDGRWKLQKSYACQMITQVGRDSPSCH